MLGLRFGATVGLCLWLAAASASAQGYGGGFGSSGDVVLGAERMFGFQSTTTSSEESGVETSDTVTQLSLLHFGGAQSPYASPRISIDGFVADSVSLGLVLGIATLSTESEVSSMGTSMTNEGVSGLGVVAGARAGYALMFADNVGIWPHVGLTYFTSTLENDDGDETSSNGLALSFDAMLVVTLAQHFGVTLGPVVDLGLTGGSETSTDAGSVETDETITDWGIMAGLLGWF